MRQGASKKILSVFFILLSSFFAVYAFTDAETYPTPDPAVIKQAAKNLLANVCSGRGGVNCSVINNDASIVCKDGTIDTSLSSIYALPQCREEIEARVTGESDFMAESGCFPPSELRCIDEESYKNLFNRLSSSGLVNSELGREELAQCQKQIQDYKKDSESYAQCLANNNRSDFELSGKTILPLLKTVFCPLFFGPESSYNDTTGLCQCADGYFMYNDRCVQATQICRLKYGTNFYAKNGSCQKSGSTPVQTQTVLPTPQKNNITPRPTPLAEKYGGAEIDYRPQPFTSPWNGSAAPTTDTPEEPETNIVKRIFSLIASSIKKLLKIH